MSEDGGSLLTHVSLELRGFVSSWHAKRDGAPKQPPTVGVQAFDPAAALGAASSAPSLFDFVKKHLEYYKEEIVKAPLLPQSGDVQEHVQKLSQVLVDAQRLGNPIIPQSQRVLNSQSKIRASSS